MSWTLPLRRGLALNPVDLQDVVCVPLPLFVDRTCWECRYSTWALCNVPPYLLGMLYVFFYFSHSGLSYVATAMWNLLTGCCITVIQNENHMSWWSNTYSRHNLKHMPGMTVRIIFFSPFIWKLKGLTHYSVNEIQRAILIEGKRSVSQPAINENKGTKRLSNVLSLGYLRLTASRKSFFISKLS